MMTGFSLTPEMLAQAKVVLVDDDELVTSSLDSFLSLEADIEAIVFNDPLKAADYLKTNPIDLIISDFLMPQMDGIQLLKVARDQQPQVPRILLTGYADKENAIRAINDIQVFQYVEKPWDNDALKQIIINGLEKCFLIRTLSEKIAELEKTQNDLEGLQNALTRTFA